MNPNRPDTPKPIVALFVIIIVLIIIAEIFK